MHRVAVLVLLLPALALAADSTYKAPNLPDVRQERIDPKEKKPATQPNLPDITPGEVSPQQRAPISGAKLPDVRPIQFPGQPPREISSAKLPEIGPQEISPEERPDVTQATLPDVGPLQSVELADFTKGLNLSKYKTKLAPNQGIVVMNVLWGEDGEAYKRPGFDTLCTFPGEPNFLYRYYQQDGDKYLMGGSDTALYFWQEDSTSWTWLAGTGGTSGRWDGTTYEDIFVGTHEGTAPVFWDGDSIISVTVLESPDSFYVEWSTIVLDTIYTGCWRFQAVFTLTSPPASFETNELIGYTFEWYEHAGSSEIQRMLVLSNTPDEISTTIPCSLDLVPDKPERWCWLRPWFQSTSVDSGTTDSVTVCYDDPDFCCELWGALASSIRFWDNTIDTTLLARDWTYIFAATDSRGNIWRNFIEDYGDIGDDIYIVMNGWMVACFDEATEYEIYRLGSLLEDEGVKFAETFDDRLWFGWAGTGVDQEKNVLIYSNLRKFIFPPENEIFLTPGDGDYITGLISLSDARYVDVPTHILMVTKNASSYKIVPTSTAGTYDSWYISTRVGCVSNSAMAVGEGLVLFPDQSGVWAWDQRSRPEPISLLIDPYFEAWDISNLEYVSAVYNPQDRHYYISLPIDTSSMTGGGQCDLTEDPDMVVTWRNVYGGETRNVWVQKMKLGGTHIGPNKLMEDTTDGIFSAEDADIVFLSDKTYISSYLWEHPFYGNDVAGWRELSRCTAPVGSFQTVDTTDLDPRLASNHTDKFVFVWEDQINHKYTTIWAQWFDTTGDSTTGWVSVPGDVDADSDSYLEPAVSMNTDGNSIFAWTDYNDGGDGDSYGNIYAARFNSSGVLVGSRFKVNDDDPYDFQSSPAVSINNAGKFVIAWADKRGANNFWEIYGQRYDTSGTAVGANFTISTVSPATAHQTYPSVSMSALGNFVVCWDDTRLEDRTNDILYQRSDSTGTLVDTNKTPYDTSTLQAASTTGSQVKMLDDGRFVIVWSGNEYDSSDCVWGQVFDSTGAVSGSVFRMNDNRANIPSRFPYFDVDPNLSAGTSTPSLSSEAWLTLARNIDNGAWSLESFVSSAYCYQHGLTDTVKVLFAQPTVVQQYGVQADDESDPVILKYQTGYFSFTQDPTTDTEIKFWTLEADLDTGTVEYSWYRDYSIVAQSGSITCGQNCREEIDVPADSVAGRNVSLYLETGTDVDDFTLSRIWLEYRLNKNRK